MIDVHVHLHPERLGQAIRRWFADNSSWKLYHPTSPAEVVSALKDHGIERFVFCSYAHKPGIARGINDWLTATATEIDRIGLPLFTVHLDDPGYLDDAKRAMASGCIGMKIHEDVQSLAIDDPRFSKIYEEIAKIKGFVLAHVGPIPWRQIAKKGVERVQAVKEKHPELNLVVAHMGAPDTNLYLPLLDQIPGLYLDTTMGFSNVEGLDLNVDLRSVEKHASHVLFGSDYPNIPYDYDREPGKLRESGMSDDALAAIMGRNAQILLAPFL